MCEGGAEATDSQSPEDMNPREIHPIRPRGPVFHQFTGPALEMHQTNQPVSLSGQFGNRRDRYRDD